MSNDLHQLHDQANEAFARRLLNELPAMRGKLGYISQAIEGDAGRPLARIDEAQFVIDQECHIGGSEGVGVKV